MTRVHLRLVNKKRERGDVKIEIVESKPSTSQEASKIDTDTLFDKIGQLFALKTGGMVSDLKLNIATSALTLKNELKLDNASLKTELKSDNASLRADVE